MKTYLTLLAFLALPFLAFAQGGGSRVELYPANSSTGVVLCGPVTISNNAAIATTTSMVSNAMSVAVASPTETCGTTVTGPNVTVGVAMPGSIAACTMDNSVTATPPNTTYILNSTITTSGPRCLATTSAPAAGSYVIGTLVGSSTTAGQASLITIAGYTYGGGSGGGPPLGTPAQVPIMNSGASAYAPQTLGPDMTVAANGVTTVTRTNNVPFGPLATATLSSTGLLNWNGSGFTFYTPGTAANNLLQLNGSGQAPVNAAGLYGTPALPTGTTAVTQTTGDNSTKVATDAFVLANSSALPSGTGILNVASSTYQALYNASATIPANYVAAIPANQIFGTAAYQYLVSGVTSPFAVTPINGPTGLTGIYQSLCAISGSAPTNCPPGTYPRRVTSSPGSGITQADCAPSRVFYESASVTAIAETIIAPSGAYATCTIQVNVPSLVTSSGAANVSVVTITPASGTINDAATLVLKPGQSATLSPDPSTSTNWITPPIGASSTSSSYPLLTAAEVATANLTLSGAQTIDGVAGTAGTTIILATAQTTTSQNGLWLMQTGSWTRPATAGSNYPTGGTTEAFQNLTVLVKGGTNYGGSTWRLTTSGALTIDTSATAWSQNLIQNGALANLFSAWFAGGSSTQSSNATLFDPGGYSDIVTMGGTAPTTTPLVQFIFPTGNGSGGAFNPAWSMGRAVSAADNAAVLQITTSGNGPQNTNNSGNGLLDIFGNGAAIPLQTWSCSSSSDAALEVSSAYLLGVLDATCGPQVIATATGTIGTHAAIPTSAPRVCTNSSSEIVSCPNWIAGGGSANAQTATYSPAIASLAAVEGIPLSFTPTAANSSTTPTFSPNSLTATTITKCGHTALVANDLTTTAIATVVYDGTDFQLQNPQAGACGTSSSGGTNTYSSSQSASTSDNGLLVVMNCSSACAYTLPNPQPSTTFHTRVQSVGSTNATIALGSSMTYNGGSSVPVLLQYGQADVYANSQTSTDYKGSIPPVAGSGVAITTSATGQTFTSTSGGGNISGSISTTGNLVTTDGSQTIQDSGIGAPTAAGGYPITFTGGANLSNSTTDYVGVGYLNASNESAAAIPMSRNATISNLFCHYGVSVTGSETIVVLVRHGVSGTIGSTSMTCTINSTTSPNCSDTTSGHDFTVATSTFDTLDLSSTPSGTPTAAALSCQVLFN